MEDADGQSLILTQVVSMQQKSANISSLTGNNKQQEHSESADLRQGSTYPENFIKIRP